MSTCILEVRPRSLGKSHLGESFLERSTSVVGLWSTGTQRSSLLLKSRLFCEVADSRVKPRLEVADLCGSARLSGQCWGQAQVHELSP